LPTGTKSLRTELKHHWKFLRTYIQKPHSVGAVAPSSRAIAIAISEPFRRSPRPARVLEVGAGTGAITRHLGTILTDRDELDICELQSEFADILERDVLSTASFRRALCDGRVRLIRRAVQQIEGEGVYDFVISGLPMSAFQLSDVEQIYTVIRRLLKPGGVFSYFEYTWLRRTSRLLAMGRTRERIRAVNAYLTRNIRDHEFARRSIIGNIPPAHIRHLRFDRNSNGNGR